MAASINPTLAQAQPSGWKTFQPVPARPFFVLQNHPCLHSLSLVMDIPIVSITKQCTDLPCENSLALKSANNLILNQGAFASRR